MLLETEVGERTSSSGYSRKNRAWRRVVERSAREGEWKGGGWKARIRQPSPSKGDGGKEAVSSVPRGE